MYWTFHWVNKRCGSSYGAVKNQFCTGMCLEFVFTRFEGYKNWPVTLFVVLPVNSNICNIPYVIVVNWHS